MANVTILGLLETNTGDQIPLRVDSTAEGTEATITTDTNLTVTAQDIGDYKPGATVTGGFVSADNSISYAYILRQGVVAALLPVASPGVSSGVMPLCRPFTLQPGDKVRALALTATARNAAMYVYTNQGVGRIFTGTPSGSGTTNLTDLQTSNEIGNTLQGQTVVKAMLTSVDGQKLVSSSGAWVLNAQGQLAGSCASSNPAVQQPGFTSLSIPIALNYVAQVRTDA